MNFVSEIPNQLFIVAEEIGQQTVHSDVKNSEIRKMVDAIREAEKKRRCIRKFFKPFALMQRLALEYELIRVIPCAGSLESTLREALENLTPREEVVLRLRYGLDDRNRRTLEEVGNRFGITREGIRQILIKAIRKLRRSSYAHELEKLMDLKDFLAGLAVGSSGL